MDGGTWKAAVHGVAESWKRLSDFTFTFHFHALEKEMATHSSVLAWRIPGTAEPGGLPSTGSHRVGHNWSDLAAAVREREKASQNSICPMVSYVKAKTTTVENTQKRPKWKSINEENGEGWRKAVRFRLLLDGTPLQYFCLENPMDGGAWWAAVHGVNRVRHDWATSLSLFTFMHWRRKWQPTPVFLPGESQGRGAWWAAV